MPKASGIPIKFRQGESNGIIGSLVAERPRVRPHAGTTLKLGNATIFNEPLPLHLISSGVSSGARVARIEIKVSQSKDNIHSLKGLHLRLLSEGEKRASKNGCGFVWARERPDNAGAIESFKSLGWNYLGVQTVEPAEGNIGGNFFVYGKNLESKR